MLAIYTRLSKEDEDSNSLKNQLREGKEFAKNNNYKDFEIYDEGEGTSGGAELSDRPMLFRLLQDISSGLITVVWFRHQNRLERNTTTYAIFTNEAKKYNVRLFFSNKELDLTDPQNVLWGTVGSAFNQYQKDLQSVQTKKTLKDNAIQGKAHGISPYGYTSDSKGFIIIEGEEAEVVKDIFKMSLSGIGTRKIAEALNERDIPTRYNKIGKGTLTTTDKYDGRKRITKKKDIKWSGNTITNIIKNPIYKGERHLKSGIYKSPNIITSIHWQKVNDNLKANRNNSGKVVNHKYLLKGIIKCSKCGRNYYGRKRVSKKDNFYMCSSKRIKSENCGNRSINIDVIEDLIWKRFFIEKDLLKLTENYFKGIDSEIKLTQIRVDIKLIEEELKANAKEHKNAVNLAIKGILSDDDIKSTMRENKTKK
jgi:site-specific DNA recombinase